MKDQRPVFKNRVQEFRLGKKLSQSDLAFLADTTRQAIALIEGHRHHPSAATALMIARALDIEFEKIFYFEEDNNEK